MISETRMFADGVSPTAADIAGGTAPGLAPLFNLEHSAWSAPGGGASLFIEWLHVLADLALFGAYTAIPVILAVLIVRRKDVGMPGLMWLFTAFILFCGIGQMIEAVATIFSGQEFSGVLKVLVATLAWLTVIAILRMTPKALASPDITRLAEDLRLQRQERRLVERMLCEKGALLDNIVENAPCGIFWKGLDDRYLGCNRMFASFMGLSEDGTALAGSHARLLCDPTQPGPKITTDVQVMESGRALLNEEIVVQSDRGPRTLLRSRVPLKDENGAIFGILGLISDVTALKSQERAIRESEQRFRGTFEQAAVGIAHVAPDGTWLRVNNKLCEILTASREELLSKRFQELTHRDDLESVLRALRGVLRGEISDFHLELRFLRSDGDEVWTHVTVSLIRDDEGGPKHFVFVVEDIGERKSAQRQIENASRAAAEANRAKSDFLAHMSHEIRTPLNGILGFAELLRRGVGTPAQQRGHLETIISSGKHLLTLIDDVLDLSKIESGHFQMELVHCSPHQIIGEVLSLLRVRAQEKCLGLEAEWATPTPARILTDPARLRQILMNVVGNAIKFTDKGEVKVVASIDPDMHEPRFVIDVIDTGIGIPEDRLEAIFAPFNQADPSITRRFGGTGLGMSISRRIAQTLGGDITVTSRVGQGSTFRITLNTGPLIDVPIHCLPFTEAAAAAELKPADGTVSLAGIHVLLAEDGKANRELIQLILEDAGARVAATVNGRDAIEASVRERFDVILMDMQMPILDGYSAARKIRELGGAPPIIALTAHAMRGDEEKCRAAGCSGYLAKPIDLTDLIRTVHRTVAGSRPDRDETPVDDRSLVPVELPRRPRIESTLPTRQPAIARIVGEFIRQLPPRIEEMWHAFSCRDYESLGRAAHWLKGSGGTMGFHCFTPPAQRLVEATRPESVPDEHSIEELLRELGHLSQCVQTPATAAPVFGLGTPESIINEHIPSL